MFEPTPLDLDDPNTAKPLIGVRQPLPEEIGSNSALSNSAMDTSISKYCNNSLALTEMKALLRAEQDVTQILEQSRRKSVQHLQDANENDATLNALKSTLKENKKGKEGETAVPVKETKSAAPSMCGEERINNKRDIGVRVRCTFIGTTSIIALLLAIAALSEPKGEPAMDNSMKNVEALYGVITGLTGITAFAIIEFYVFEWRMMRADCRALKIKEKSYWLHNVVPLTIELLVHLPHPIPTHGWELYSLFFMSAMFARVYTLLRVVAYNHLAYPMRFDIFGPQAVKFPKVKIQWPTLIKVVFLEYPMLMFFIAMWYVVLWGSFTVYIAERETFPIGTGYKFNKFTHCLWFTFITGLTVGYGDFVPWTTLGKLAAVGLGLGGVVLANMIAAILAVKFNASPAESEIMNHLLKYHNRGDLERESANVLKFFFQSLMHKKRQKIGLCVISRTRMETAVQKAKVARNILMSLVSDDARLKTDLGDVLTTSKIVRDEQTKKAQNLNLLNKSSARQFMNLAEKLIKMHGHVSNKQQGLLQRVQAVEDVLQEVVEEATKLQAKVEDLMKAPSLSSMLHQNPKEKPQVVSPPKPQVPQPKASQPAAQPEARQRATSVKDSMEGQMRTILTTLKKLLALQEQINARHLENK